MLWSLSSPTSEINSTRLSRSTTSKMIRSRLHDVIPNFSYVELSADRTLAGLPDLDDVDFGALYSFKNRKASFCLSFGCRLFQSLWICFSASFFSSSSPLITFSTGLDSADLISSARSVPWRIFSTRLLRSVESTIFHSSASVSNLSSSTSSLELLQSREFSVFAAASSLLTAKRRSSLRSKLSYLMMGRMRIP